MPKTRSPSAPAALPTPATNQPQDADVCTAWQGRTLISALTAAIGHPDEMADLHQWYERTHPTPTTESDRIAELEQRCKALESMVDTLTELLLYGPQTDAQ